MSVNEAQTGKKTVLAFGVQLILPQPGSQVAVDIIWGLTY